MVAMQSFTTPEKLFTKKASSTAQYHAQKVPKIEKNKNNQSSLWKHAHTAEEAFHMALTASKGISTCFVT